MEASTVIDSPSAYRASRREVYALLAILVLAFLMRMVFLHEPFERDEGLYAYIGQEILRGAIPYRDMIDQKPPAIHYIYALSIAVLGATTEAIRIFTALYALVTTYFVYRTARYLSGPLAGLLAALGFGVFSSGPMVQGASSNTEVFLILPALASVYLFLRAIDTRSRAYLAGCGLLSGVAMLVKPVALPPILLIVIFIFFIRGRDKTLRDVSLDLACFAVPPLALASLTLAYFAFHGALADFYHWNITFNRSYGDIPFVEQLLGLRAGAATMSEHYLLWAAALPTAFWLAGRERSLKTVFIALLIPASFIGVCMAGYYRPHYYIQMLPPLAIVAGIGFAKLWEGKGRPLIAAIPVVVACLAVWMAQDYRYYFVYTPAEVSAHKYRTPLFADVVDVARYIKERTAPEDYIYQWGFEPELYFLSDRRAPNRFTIWFFVEKSREPAAAVRELVDSIATKKPKYVVLQDGAQYVFGYKELFGVLSRDYAIDRQTPQLLLLRHK
jgi:4-amino-4-deoxy-L-arabinose transferase-like glycosyltransferase